MNIWVAKLGSRNFSEEDTRSIKSLLKDEFEIKDLESAGLFEYKSGSIHYLSFQRGTEYSNKTYNYVSENRLTAYSGLLVGKKDKGKDYRSAQSIEKISQTPNQFLDTIAGAYSVIHATDTDFQCFVDNTGLYKVFYYESPNNEVFVSNFIDLVKLFKDSQINRDAFLDWLTLEYVLFQETEEKNIYTLPEYGQLNWNSATGLEISQFKDQTEIFYNSSAQQDLFDKTVFEFRNCAENLLKYHNCIVPLSGGFDSRLILSMFWGLDKSELDSYTLFDNHDDIPIAKRIAKDHSISHKILNLPEELPTFEELHKYLMQTHFPFLKYSKVFEYLGRKSIREAFPERWMVQLKGYGGNSDRRISEYDFLDNFEEQEAIENLTDHLLSGNEILDRETFQYMRERIRSYYSQKYLPIITGRGKDHRLKCMLYKARYKLTADTRNIQIYGEFDNWFYPLLMDSFQTLIFNNATNAKLSRGKRGSIYHHLFRSLTKREDKPIHFTSGLHWEANKLSRAKYRIHKKMIEKYLRSRFPYKEKNTVQIKRDFFRKNISEFQKILQDATNSFLWDYLNKDKITRNFLNTEKYDDKYNQLVFKKIIPILKMEQNSPKFDIKSSRSKQIINL